jgi:hypothetical protein
MWQNQKLHLLLIRMQNVTATMEDGLAALYKAE